MTEPNALHVTRRAPYPGAAYELSRLAISVTVEGRTADPSGSVTLLRRAFAAGVTTFDTVDVPDPALSETVLAQAFPDGDPRIVVLTGHPSVGPRGGRSLVRPTFASTGGDIERSARASPDFRRLVEVDSTAWAATTTDRSDTQERPVSAGVLPSVVRCHRVDEVLRVSRATPPCLVSGPFSLLEQALPTEAASAVGEGSLRWIARDPLAGGRLDGSRFAAGRYPSVGSSPRSVRELGEEFAPVAALGFLARTGERTLAQAALRFVTDLPWVATAVVPIPTPTRWQEVLGFDAAPPLTDEERARVEGRPRTPNVRAPSGPFGRTSP